MIKKLRIKFIIIAMSSVFIVLALIISMINVINYTTIGSDADEIIAVIAEHNGDMPTTGDPFKSDEALYTTRFFSVTLTENGEVVYCNTKNIAAVTYTEAQSYALDVYASGKTSGYYGNYRYSVTEKTDEVRFVSAKLYIFLDCTEDRDSFYNFLWASISMSIAGMIVVFALVYFLSKMAVKPIAESYEKQKRFITDASHEIKTPLTIIDANTEVLEMTGGENEWTESIRNQVKRLTSMTEKLVFLSRMDENAGKEKMIDFSLTDAVEETAQPFVTLASTRGKSLTINAESNITYYGNEGEIRQLVSILLDNAVKYSDENGKIELTMQNVGKYNEITVKNTVDEIEQGRHDELFERFYRSDRSHNSETGGNGIGLSIAKAVTDHHHGRITARSDDGKSLTITAVL